MAARKASGTVRVEPVPGLYLEPLDAPPDDAALLVATGSYRYTDPSDSPAPAVTADTAEEAANG